MEKIAIYGAGGFGKDVAFILETLKDKYELIGFFDDGLEKETVVSGYPTLGGIEDLNNYPSTLSIVFAINKGVLIEQIYGKITNKHISFPNIMHPSSYIDLSTLEIGIGNVFNINVIVSKDVKIGNFNSFNNRVAIGHDVVIGNFNSLSPSVQISGGVNVGNNNSFGLNSSIIQYKKVGDDNKIGASSLIIRNVSDSNSVFGIPAIISKF